MPNASIPLTNFTAGELTPLLEARVDLAQYANGCRTVSNFLIHPQGGVYRRGGTEYIAGVKTNSKKVRLVPFEFSISQAYVLEFGENYIRFYANQGQVVSGSPSAAVEVTTTYSESELFDLQFAQSADILYITHPDHAPAQLTRTAATTFTLADTVFEDGPWLDENIETTTLTPSGTTGSVNITASATTGINNGDGFQSTDVGRLVRIGHVASAWAASTSYSVGDVVRNNDNIYECIRAGTSAGSGGPDGEGDSIVDNGVTWEYIQDGGVRWGYAEITSITSTTIAVATVKKAFGGTSAETSWRLGAWYGGSYPGSVAFYEQRLFYAGSTDNPQTLWGSKSGDYTNFTPGSLDDDGVTYTIATDQVNAIRWLSPGKVLAVGTAGGEFKVSASTNEEALTPTNVRVVRETSYGSANILPQRVGEVVLYTQRAGRKIREFVYQFETDGFVSPDLTLLAEHISQTGIVEIEYQQEPDSIVWCVLTDGSLAALTYQREQKVIGWHKHILGGTSDAAGTQSVVESVAVIPGSEDDEVWVAVKRYVNGGVVRYVELLKEGLDPTASSEDAFFVDSGLTLDSASTISGATQADPVVLTVTSHPFSNTEYVDIRGVAGTTEINGRRFIVADSATNTFSLVPDKSPITASITGATQANPVVITATSHGLTDGEVIYIQDVAGMVEINGLTFTVANKTDDTFELSGINGTGYTAYTSGGTIRHAEDGTAHTAYISGGTVREAVTTISGLSHLEGESVDILANGAVQAAKTVSSGAITLDTRASIVHAGLGYTSQLETQRIEGGSMDGTAQGKIKRIHEVVLRIYRSLGIEVGKRDGEIDTIPFRDSSDVMDAAPALYSGDLRVDFSEGFDRKGTVYFRQQQPLPLTVLGVFAHLKTNG
jgi:hypothetical protein